ncbi:MAG: YciI family protein [Blastocatellia bacterium]
MKTLFLVTRIRGLAWDISKPMNSQEQWSEHATFMNRLAAEGFVVLGGPVDESGDILLVVDAADESEIDTILLRDPWSQSGILEIKTIKWWTVLLQAGERTEGNS